MPRLNLVYDHDEYGLPATWLYLDDLYVASQGHKPWHKREAKSTGYRELFYLWLREADDYYRPLFQSDELCQALGEALTRQEWRYFKQAYYLAHRHLTQEIGPLATINSSVVANFSRVRRAYEKARADRPSR